MYNYKEGEKLETHTQSNGFSRRSSPEILPESADANDHDLSEEIKQEFLKEQEQESIKRRKAGIQVSRERSAIKLQQQEKAEAEKPAKRAPEVQQLPGTRSAYIKNSQKNQFFARTLRYQAYIPESVQIHRKAKHSASQPRIRSGRPLGEKHGSTSHLSSKVEASYRPQTASAVAVGQDYRVTNEPRVMSNSRYRKVMLLGTRPTFSKEYVTKGTSDVIVKTTDYKQYKPEEFPIFYNDVLPTDNEGLDHLARIDLIKKDAKSGHEIDHVIDSLQKSQALNANYENVSKTYYIHKNRDEKLRIPERVIPHSEALRIAKELFPTKDYTGKDMDEFAQLYDSINNNPPMSNFTIQDLEEQLRDFNIDKDERKRLESVLMLLKHSRKPESDQNDNLRKKRVQKEFERRQHDAILAMHYLRLHEFYKDKNYAAYANNLQKSKSSAMISKKDLTDEQLKKLSYQRNAKQIARSIVNEGNFEGAKFTKMVTDREKLKQETVYVQSQPFAIPDDMEQLYPGIRDRFEKFKGKKFEGWNFEDEVDKARLRWNEENLVNLHNLGHALQEGKRLELRKRVQRTGSQSREAL